ncbi:hypothetical protein T4E_9745 [Trichinella pseudospiralis]|uniref:Uncharacterized protein n=1 Tax=Trichinella pseudospiralis TaxID=6337 RepID=A0A0V0YKY5_TRIPS|nr:hypothetical protein T4E_9745 [Trichinella pseudospiralis]
MNHFAENDILFHFVVVTDENRRGGGSLANLLGVNNARMSSLKRRQRRRRPIPDFSPEMDTDEWLKALENFFYVTGDCPRIKPPLYE